MVKTISKPIPAQSSPGSTRTTSDIGVPGYLTRSGLQDSGSPTKRPGKGLQSYWKDQPNHKGKDGLEMKTKR